MRHWIAALPAMLYLALTGNAAAETLRLAADPWPPYVDRALPYRGLAVGIVTEALSRAGYTTTLTVSEWELVMDGVRQGDFDAIVGAWYSEERSADLAFSEPYLFNELKLVKLREATFSFEDILAHARPELTMGLVRDYAYGEALAPLKAYANRNQTFLTQTLLRLVKTEVDFVVGDDRAVRYQLHELLTAHADRVAIAEEPLSRVGLRFAVAQGHPKRQQLLADFARALARMKEDGTLETLLSEFRFAGATSADPAEKASAPGSEAPVSPAAP